MIQPLSSTSRTMKIGLTSETTSIIDMSTTAYWNIRARLLRVTGVANIAIWGERLNMYQVQTDPGRLNAHQVSLDEVMQVTADALDSGLLQYSAGGFIGTGGFVETANQRLSLQNVLPIVTPEDLAQVAVAERDGRTLRLADVADVVEDHQPLIGDAVINDGPGLMLIVEKFPWANTVDVTNGVEAAIDELRPGLAGIEIDTSIFRPATFIELAIDNLTLALLIGCLLVILIIGAFLFEWRTALISVVAIPIKTTIRSSWDAVVDVGDPMAAMAGVDFSGIKTLSVIDIPYMYPKELTDERQKEIVQMFVRVVSALAK